MKKITKACFGFGAVAAIAGASALVAFAWGPNRTTYTLEKPADHIVFNSITNNNKEVGDERYFVSASEYTGNANNNKWTDETMVEEGKEYVVRMYVHNNAASNLNLVAENVKAFVVLPTETATSITVNGKISASNANPTTVWDGTTFKSKNGEKFNLTYVKGSAKYYNTKDGKLRTFNLDTANYDLFTSKGMLLGYDKMDGKIPGCNQYSGYVTFHVKPQFATVAKPDYTISKEVRLNVDGAKWGEQVTAKAGETVRYRLHFVNTGNTTLKNVTIRDILPTGLSYVEGSTTLTNTAHPKGVALSDNLISDKGVNLGDYAPNAGAWITFNATVNKAVAEKCGNTMLRNVAQANAGNGTKEDAADVLVYGKTCQEEEQKPGFTINKMVQLDGGKEWSENVTAAAGSKVRYRIQFKNTGNTELKNVVVRDMLPAGMSYVKGTTVLYNSANKNGKTLGDGIITENGINIGNYAKGTEATIYFYATVNGSLKDNCSDSKLTNTVKGKYNNDDKTAKTDTADVTVNGKVCEEPTPTPTPTPTPVELPKTGAASIITGIMGIASTVTATAYYISSRKK